mmetsp:Transcript_28448/g.21255  ORF Transcript_28448/g.21255 Transcript_28448/m.21255 type:complete len:118 (+) Transcript_28448:447-800(+)|eukprot:CAMPEP_0202969066 /NCGR_PEP_ID=MMETSP1396-20130829/14661_1 /ASSEMBLY_ACC=CAM_ASM_000872 /TAXON_ID= /ORGANISM="Pseudokeronopsis sp., Strain Brazil" /LENGTH=117 /DNA_ID=CAMNT_0049696161 /DNA_START=419 /DNA_END=772 /DNA_ORIENTATION=+
MSLGQEKPWLTGAKVRAWEYSINGHMPSFPDKVEYKYSIQNEEDEYIIWEREPSREIRIQDPQTYTGHLGINGNSRQENINEVFVVNGVIDKADANFVGGLEFNEIPGVNICIGPYP